MATLGKASIIQQLTEDIIEHILYEYDLSVDGQKIAHIIDTNIGIIVESKTDGYIDLSIV